jgi:hypothetical protein
VQHANTTLQTPLLHTITHACQLYMFIRMYMTSEILSIQISGYISSDISSSSLTPIASAAISHRKHPTTTGPQLVTCSNTRTLQNQVLPSHLASALYECDLERWPPASKCSSCRTQPFNWETPRQLLLMTASELPGVRWHQCHILRSPEVIVGNGWG